MSAAGPSLRGVSSVKRYPAERVAPYNADWASRYGELALPLQAALGSTWHVEHVGSTSVPGLSAKPVIDLALGEPLGHDKLDSVLTFRGLGWTDPVSLGDHRAIFLIDGGVRIAIAHIFSNDQWLSAHVRLFADWLRTHASDRDEYERLKNELVAAGLWGSEYTQAKADFVGCVVNRARACRGLPPVQSL
jgi:GrpB-like predicted nucleotidyltransferase (UPF0157 family)